MEQEHDVSKRPSSMLEYVRLLAKTSHTVRWVFGLMDTSKSRAMLICIVLCSTVGMACFSYGSYTISDFFTAAENRNYAAVVSNLAWFSLMLCLAQFSWLMGSFACHFSMHASLRCSMKSHLANWSRNHPDLTRQHSSAAATGPVPLLIW